MPTRQFIQSYYLTDELIDGKVYTIQQKELMFQLHQLMEQPTRLEEIDDIDYLVDN